MTLYPVTKCTPARAADIVEMYGPERLMVNSAGDWGPSKPTAVPDFIFEMRKRGHAESLIRRVVYDNPLEFFAQSKNFRFTPRG
jgi:predicted metal-dependent TIM-barrel fold hydrolase